MRRTSTIYQARITLACMFFDAVENDVIAKNPVTKAVKYNIGKGSKKIRALTIEEQKKRRKYASETLQVILGHSNVGIAINLYVHVMEEEKVKEIEKIDNVLKIV